MLISVALSAVIASPNVTGPPPAKVSDAVSAAITCFEAVAPKGVVISRLTSAGWRELLDAQGKPETRGGHAFRRSDISAEIAVVGRVCSLVAPVESFEDAKATLLQLDDAIHPDNIEESDRGVLLRKGERSVMFLIGKPTVQKPAVVRIDTEFSETR